MKAKKFTIIALPILIFLGLPLIILLIFTLSLTDSKSIPMPNGTEIMQIGGYNQIYFIDEQGTLWATGNDSDSMSIGTPYIKKKTEPVKIAENVSEAGNSFYISKGGELYVWNTLAKLLEVSNSEQNKTPVKTSIANVKTVAYTNKNFALLLLNNGDLLGIGNEPFCLINGKEATLSNPKIIAKNIDTVCASECSVYMISQNKELFSMGNNESGVLGTANVHYLNDPFFVADNVKKASMLSSDHGGFLNSHGELYLLGILSNGQSTNTPAFYTDGVKDFCRSYENTFILTDNNELYVDNYKKIMDDVLHCYSIGGHQLFITSNYKVYGCGPNLDYELGRGLAHIDYDHMICINP